MGKVMIYWEYAERSKTERTPWQWRRLLLKSSYWRDGVARQRRIETLWYRLYVKSMYEMSLVGNPLHFSRSKHLYQPSQKNDEMCLNRRNFINCSISCLLPSDITTPASCRFSKLQLSRSNSGSPASGRWNVHKIHRSDTTLHTTGHYATDKQVSQS